MKKFTDKNHPALYVFIGKLSNAAQKVVGLAEKFHLPQAVFSLCNDDISEIRAVKAKIQQGGVGLNLNRINIFVATEVCDVKFSSVAEAGARLKEVFTEDFAVCNLSLAVLISEASDANDFDARNRATFEFLKACGDGLPEIFNQFFLLSDRNENGVVSAGNRENCLEVLGCLPGIKAESDYFNEIVAAKARAEGRVLFSSVGVAVDMPDEVAKNPDELTIGAAEKHALVQLAEKLDAECDANESSCSYNNEANLTDTEILAKIKSEIVSVAAKPLFFRDLFGVPIVDAEQMLFGKQAARFYEENYNAENAYSEAMAHASEFVPIKMPLRQAAAEEKNLRLALIKLADEIAQQEQILTNKRESPQPIKFLQILNYVDAVKDTIAETYTIIYQITALKKTYANLNKKHKHLETYIKYICQTTQALRDIPVQVPAPHRPKTFNQLETQAAINISLIRDDGLIRETHTLTDIDGNLCVVKLVGGFAAENLMRYRVMSSTHG